MILRPLTAGLITLGLWASAVAADLRITGIVREADGSVRVTHDANTGSYYLLLRGDRLETIATPRDAALGVAGVGTLRETTTPAAASFFRVQEVSRDTPLDSDSDGIDDVYELERAGELNPLDATDASKPVPGGGGQTYLQAYQEQQAPLVRLASTSPFTGEDGVAVTRETVFRLTGPLAANTLITTDQVYATFAGRKVLSRVEVAGDGRSVTLFALENLPSSARVRVTFDPGDTRDSKGRKLDLAGTGTPGSAARIDFDTLSITSVGETAVIGHIYASEKIAGAGGALTNLPLANVTITVDGAEETLRTTTDADGFFKLQPAPAGRFFVHVDGRTSVSGIPDDALPWSERAYYPVVGKAWEAVAGVTTNLANSSGVVYLPLIEAGSLVPVSAVDSTPVRFLPKVLSQNPALAGTTLTVPANSLYDDNGVRGGRVGLAPVASDRLPEPLPPGLEHILDITVQSDGPRNFDQPVPVRFPNLPSPTTGESLPPGAQTALVSFNHDVGRWEVVGTMTVSADGKFLDSDPGVGIRQPGWHGWQRLTWPEFYPPVIWPPFPNTWVTVNPPGPFPPPFPQPPGPDFPDDYPPGPWPDFPPWPDDGPPPPPKWPDPNDPDWTDWPPLPPWDNEPPGDPGDGPGGPGDPGGGSNNDGSNAADPGGVSAGPFCLEPNIEEGCDNSGIALAGANTVAISANGGPDYQLTYSQLQGTVTAEVRSGGRLVFATQVNPIRPPNSVGFGPAAQAFVHVFRQATGSGLSGNEVVQLVTLPKDRQNYAPSRTITLGASYLNASSVSFSPHGRYLVYTALKTDGKIALTVIDVVTRETVFTGSYPYSTAPVLVQPADMVQFGPDCADRTMVFHFGDTPTTLAWHAINLETRRVIALRTATPDSSAWAFSSCGDAVSFKPGPGPQVEYLATLDGKTIAGLNAAGASARLARAGTIARADAANASDRPVPRPRYSRGLHYYEVVDMLSGQIVKRDHTGASGVLMEGVLLSPNRPYRLSALRASDFAAGQVDFVSGNVGQSFRPPSPILEADTSADTDGEGLSNFAESILGTDPNKPDSNGDGITDAAAVRAGLDPLEGGALATGVIAAVPLGGSAVDVCAVGDRVILALGNAGVAVVQHPPGQNPTVIARVDTPGDARRVTCSGNFVAVADGSGGLQIVDITDPPAARISSFLPAVGEANCVTAANGVAYVGTQAGQVVLVNLATGTELGRISVGAPVQDLQFGGDRLYVLSDRRLLPYRLETGELLPSGPAVTSGSGGTANRLFVGGGLAYVTHSNGYRVFDLADPDRPVELTSGDDTQGGWQHLVSNGSALGLAAAGPQPGANNQVQIYSLSDPARNDQFIARYQLPAPAVGVAIHHGVGYIADTTAGLQVLNYLAADTGTNPPAISLTATFPLSPAQVESGRFVAVQAAASDDVQVREVEFYVDGARVAEDGSFPFEYAFVTPVLTAERTGFRLRAKATDTAGNSKWSEEILVTLLPDQTPPRVRLAAPAANGFAVSPTNVALIFNEAIDPATLTTERFTLTYLGTDRTVGTVDDVPIIGTLAYRADARLGELQFANVTNPGRYRAQLLRGVADVTGNAMPQDNAWEFEVVIGVDSDGDGLTDDYELTSGLDPQKADQNGNGIPDSLDDFDSDGLNSGFEMMLGTDAKKARTFGDVLDRDLDRDADFLTDIREVNVGTDYLRADTDGDGWNDEIEITTGASPFIRNAYLPGVFTSRNLAHVLVLDGPQFRSAQGDLLRLADGQAVQSTSTANVLRQGGPNENGYTVNQALPPVRIRQFDLEATDLSPNELPTTGAFVIEAEDYNHSSGQHVPAASVMPYLGGAYDGLAAVLGVDFFNTDGNDSDLYRPDTAPNNVNLIPNLGGRYGIERPGWNSTNSLRIGWTASSDWQQYTRTIPPGQYWIWGALSHSGRSAGQLSASLDLVTGDASLPNPALTQLGTFNAPGSGAYGNNSLVVLRDGTSAPYVLNVTASATTFRLNLASGDFDWFVLVPTNSAPQ